MKFLRGAAVAVVLFQLCLMAVAKPAPTTAPVGMSVENVIDALPRLSDRDPNRKSFRMHGWVKFLDRGNRIAFEVAYSAKHGRMLRVYDPVDETVFLWVAGRRCYAYDITQGRLLELNAWRPNFTFVESPTRLNCRWGLDYTRLGGERAGAYSEMKIDLRSLFAAGEKHLIQPPNAEGVVLLTTLLPSGESAATAQIKGTGKAARLVELRIDQARPKKGTMLMITHLEVDTELDSDLFKEPLVRPEDVGDLPFLRPHVDNVTITAEEGSRGAAIGAMIRAALPAAIADPTLRPALDKEFGRVDWDAIAAQDARVAPLVRKVLPLQGARLADAASLPATQPSTAPAVDVNDVIDAIPLLSDRDPTLRSFRVRGSIAPGGGQGTAFDIAYSAQFGRMIRVYDAESRTVVIWIAQRRGVLYDMIEGRLIEFPATEPSYRVTTVAEDLGAVWKYSIDRKGSSRADEYHELFLDLRGAFPAGSLRIGDLGDGRYTLTANHPTGKLTSTAVIRGSGKAAELERLEVQRTVDKSPMLKIDLISVNTPLPRLLFEFPNFDRGALGGLRLVQLGKDADEVKRDPSIDRAGTTAFILPALRNPDYQKQLLRHSPKLDWEMLKRNDESFSPIVRKALPIAED